MSVKGLKLESLKIEDYKSPLKLYTIYVGLWPDGQRYETRIGLWPIAVKFWYKIRVTLK